jgi:ATP-dependent RNA helicase RhlE
VFLLNFTALSLSEPILRAVASEGYSVATPVQAQAIPHILSRRDVLGCAQTGTGKTAAFALPVLHRLSEGMGQGGSTRPRCLVLCPTRELATQIGESFRVYGKHVGLRIGVVFGGVGINPQAGMLRRGVDILVATPGRLRDLMGQGFADLSGVEILVLDEADRMLDMGFIEDIRRIVASLPSGRQTLLFSATMPGEIRRFADGILRDPASVQIGAVSRTADNIDQSVYFVERAEKPALLARLVNDLPMARAVVFTRTKHGADRLVRRLHASGISSEAIHGNKSQNARQRALDNFRRGKMPVLVATDVASRGIDVDGITHVVNYDLTDEPETYVHRIGRTARAGASGSAVSFCDSEEVVSLRAIEKLIRRPIPVRTASRTPMAGKGKPQNSHQTSPGARPEGRPQGRPLAQGQGKTQFHGAQAHQVQSHQAPKAKGEDLRRDERRHLHPLARHSGHAGKFRGRFRAPAGAR